MVARNLFFARCKTPLTASAKGDEQARTRLSSTIFFVEFFGAHYVGVMDRNFALDGTPICIFLCLALELGHEIDSFA